MPTPAWNSAGRSTSTGCNSFWRRWPGISTVCRWLFVLVLGTGSAFATGRTEVWILVDTEVRRLDVYRGYTPIRRFRNISLGSSGAAPLHMEGDATTPLGEFRIIHINRDSRFHIFLGLNYPTRAHIDRAWQQGLVDAATHEAFMSTHRPGGRPPQNTPLGGHIGIHGIGAGDPGIHARFDWTQGCIALTNEQIEKLAGMVGVGTRVFVR